MRVRGPLVTLSAVGALAGALWIGNVSQEQATPAPAVNATAPTTSVPAPPPRPAPAFPATATYTASVPTKKAPIALEITVNGATATAYACDNVGIEEWLRGSAVNGALSLTSRDASSRLEGRLQGAAVVGTLWIGDKQWAFEAVQGGGDV